MVPSNPPGPVIAVSTASGVGRIVKMASAPVAASLRFEAATSPRDASPASCSRRVPDPVTEKPPASRREATADPRSPTPTTAMRFIWIPSPLSAQVLLQSEIPRLDLFVAPERVRGARVHDPAAREHMNVIGNLQRHREILLDEQGG